MNSRIYTCIVTRLFVPCTVSYPLSPHQPSVIGLTNVRVANGTWYWPLGTLLSGFIDCLCMVVDFAWSGSLSVQTQPFFVHAHSPSLLHSPPPPNFRHSVKLDKSPDQRPKHVMVAPAIWQTYPVEWVTAHNICTCYFRKRPFVDKPLSPPSSQPWHQEPGYSIDCSCTCGVKNLWCLHRKLGRGASARKSAVTRIIDNSVGKPLCNRSHRALINMVTQRVRI